MAERYLIAGDRLATLRAEQFLTQEEFADRLGMSTAGVRRLERAPLGGIQLRNFRALAELTQLSPEELKARVGPPKWWVLPVAGQSPTLPTPTTEAVEGGTRLPLPQPRAFRDATPEPVVEMERFHGVSASRTDERSAVQQAPIFAPSGALRRFSVVVDGDCMEPHYRHGDVAIFSVDAAEREGILNGRNYFIQLTDGQNTFKRICFIPEDKDRLLLCCWNPRYAPLVIERRQIVLLARAEYRLIPDGSNVHGL